MNDTMIEAMSQFEIPRPILRSSVWPRRHRQVSGTGPPGTVCEQCSFYGYGMQHPNSCYRYLEEYRHTAPLPISTPSSPPAAKHGPADRRRLGGKAQVSCARRAMLRGQPTVEWHFNPAGEASPRRGRRARHGDRARGTS